MGGRAMIKALKKHGNSLALVIEKPVSELNGFDFDAPEDDFAEMVLAVAQGELGKTDVAVFIRRFTRPVRQNRL